MPHPCFAGQVHLAMPLGAMEMLLWFLLLRSYPQVQSFLTRTPSCRLGWLPIRGQCREHCEVRRPVRCQIGCE